MTKSLLFSILTFALPGFTAFFLNLLPGSPIDNRLMDIFEHNHIFRIVRQTLLVFVRLTIGLEIDKITAVFPHCQDFDDRYADLYLFHQHNGQTVKLRPEDVLHIPGLGFDGIMGYSPIVLKRMPSVWDSPPKNLNKLGSTYARDVVCTALPISCRLASSSCPCPALPYLWPVSRQ